jgi:hypothetical protein
MSEGCTLLHHIYYYKDLNACMEERVDNWNVTVYRVHKMMG